MLRRYVNVWTGVLAGVAALAVVVAVGCANNGGDAGDRSGEAGGGGAAATNFNDDLDFAALPSDFAAAIAQVRAAQPWDDRGPALSGKLTAGVAPRDVMKLEMDRATLEASFALGSAYLVKWQKPAGNFRYMYDWLDGTWVEDDNQVRQAGSLWGIALCHRYRPDASTEAALRKGLQFWFDHSNEGDDGMLIPTYPGEDKITSGTVGLIGLSIIELLKTDTPLDDAYRAELEAKLDGYLKFLVYLQRSNGQFAKDYRIASGRKADRSSPYYDGETLLCLCKAARQLGHDELVPVIERGARACAETYTVDAWAKDIDSKNTKGFYQWGSMAFLEYYQAKWTDYELYGDVTLALGWWMIHTHETLKKSRNHAYAIEGLISAYRIAELEGDQAAMVDLLYTVDRSLHKLTAWQIGGPLASENGFLKKNPTDDPMAVGGVMNARKPSGKTPDKDVSHQLRIDVTQHQMHGVTLALELVYPQ